MDNPHNIVIGQPPRILEAADVTWTQWLPVLGVQSDELTVFETEVHLPRVLTKHGFFKSTSKVRQATPKKGQLPFVRDLGSPEFTELKIGHKRVWLIVGEVD